MGLVVNLLFEVFSLVVVSYFILLVVNFLVVPVVLILPLLGVVVSIIGAFVLVARVVEMRLALSKHILIAVLVVGLIF